ncbi:MAG: hypothetical protein EOO62_06095 [Hymenobacter sp.]|nr:MAG: hypothetical protein EOO62_06095 [Hymenobacter sp.]
MIEDDRINWCDWTADGGALEYDLNYLHPELGVLLQEYQVNPTTYEGKLIYQSDFYLFEVNALIPGDFQKLPRLIKSEPWEIIFAVKRKFFEEIKPEIVEHFIGREHSLEQRFALYCDKLNLPDYEIDIYKIRRTIIYQKRETPTGSGGGSCLY